MSDGLRPDTAAEVANLMRELAYALAKWIATDDNYWLEQADYIEREIAIALQGKNE